MEQVVVGFDGSKPSMDAMRWAAGEAEARGFDVLVIESWHEPFFAGPSLIEVWEDPMAAEHMARVEMDAAVDEVRQEFPNVRFSTELVSERPALALTAASQRDPLVVVGARGRGGFASLLLGSVSQHVATAASSTVVVVREPGEPDGDVVVGIDGSEHSRRALVWAAEAARHRNSRLRVVLAWNYLKPIAEHGAEAFRPHHDAADAEAAARAIVDEVLGREDEVIVEVVCDLAARALIERAGEAALLVVAPRGWTRHVHVDLGSVTLQLLHHAPCPLAIVRTSA